MIYLRLFSSVLLLLSMPLGVLRAQDAVVNVQLRTYSVDGAIENLSCLTSEGAIKVDVPAGRRSKPIRYRGAEKLVFFRESEQIEGEPIQPVATVTLPGDVRNPLLIFIRSQFSQDLSQPAATDVYRIIVINDDPFDFKNGGMKFVNLTPIVIFIVAGQNDDFKASLEPAGVASYQLDADFKGNLPLKIAAKSSRGWAPLMDSRVFPTLEARDLYFILPISDRSAGHKVRISNLRERGDNAAIRLKPNAR